MILATSTTPTFIDENPFDIVERKGIGHPDSLADGLAEAISREYSLYCLKHTGHILHHNTDKTALLGGASFVTFKEGYLTQPIFALVNGRLSRSFGDDIIPIEEIITSTTQQYLKSILPLLDVKNDLSIQMRLSLAPSPGSVKSQFSEHAGSRNHWFTPRTLDDLSELRKLFANDTSCGVGYAPPSVTERVAFGIEQYLNSTDFKSLSPEFGSDIKVMVCRKNWDLHITLCVPQIALYTPDLETYIERKKTIYTLVHQITSTLAPSYKAHISINTRDNHDINELYLTAIGSSIESGDEGVVGRGNRPNGLISIMRSMSIEGASGKNPMYHIGKLYNILAMEAAKRIFSETNRPTTVCLVSQSGGDFVDPWFVAIEQAGLNKVDEVRIHQIVEEVINSVNDIRNDLLYGRQKTF